MASQRTAEFQVLGSRQPSAKRPTKALAKLSSHGHMLLREAMLMIAKFLVEIPTPQRT